MPARCDRMLTRLQSAWQSPRRLNRHFGNAIPGRLGEALKPHRDHATDRNQTDRPTDLYNHLLDHLDNTD